MKQIDDFQIVRELGRGGMGVVYEAIEEPLGRRVALKLIHPGLAAGPELEARFLEEARQVARLSHPGIVKIHRFGRSEAQIYLALEFVDGRPLDQALQECAPGVPRTVSILKQTALALGHAHQMGIIHRDVKPGNVFVRRDDSVVLGDFGLAKDLAPKDHNLTRSGCIMGTPAYMSPEQAQGQLVTPATDLYSLGVMAFEMLSGRVPFTADSAVSLLLKQVSEPVPDLKRFAPEAPRELIALVHSLLEKDPGKRPRDGNQVADILAGFGARPNLDDVTTMESRAVTLPENSHFEELEITAAAFELRGFARVTVQAVLPARAAFLLESWYRLAHQAILDAGGVVDRHIADRVTSIFGYPDRNADHAQMAVRAGLALQRALTRFNRAHDLSLEMRAGIACGVALVGRIRGDTGPISAQGPLMGEMQRLGKTKLVSSPLRLNRSAYRRAHTLASFTRFDEPDVGESWAAEILPDAD